jgi:hypothetical protein
MIEGHLSEFRISGQDESAPLTHELARSNVNEIKCSQMNTQEEHDLNFQAVFDKY